MPKADQYDLKTNIPVEVRLGKVYQNEGQYGPFIRLLAWMREPTESDYRYRSILSDFDLLAQLHQLEFTRDEEKLNDDGLPYVETLKEGESDVIRILLEEHENPKTRKRYTKARVTHFWDGEIWQDAPELRAEPPNDPPPPPPAAGPPPSVAPPTEPPPSAPGAPPAPAPATGREKHDHLTIGYNYHIARCLCATAGVSKADLPQATTTVFIELMRNEPLQPTAWYRNLFNDVQEGTGDDGLPF